MTMRIYDRCGGSAVQARLDQRRDYIQTCTKPFLVASACVAIVALAHILLPREAVGALLVCAVVFMYYALRWDCLYPLGQNDLFTFGFDGQDFALVGMNGKVKRVVRPSDLKQISIRRARRACWRTRMRRRNGYVGALFARFGEQRLANGKKCFVPEPMVLLDPIEPVQDDGKISWGDKTFSPMDVFLYGNIGFVPKGENREIFISLLQNSACPVVVNQDFYALHSEFLDEIFAGSGMDMNRVIFEGEGEEDE